MDLGTAVSEKYDFPAYTKAVERLETNLNKLIESYCFFAFNDKQANEGMARFADALESGDELVSIGCYREARREYYRLAEENGW